MVYINTYVKRTHQMHPNISFLPQTSHVTMGVIPSQSCPCVMVIMTVGTTVMRTTVVGTYKTLYDFGNSRFFDADPSLSILSKI